MKKIFFVFVFLIALASCGNHVGGGVVGSTGTDSSTSPSSSTINKTDTSSVGSATKDTSRKMADSSSSKMDTSSRK